MENDFKKINRSCIVCGSGAVYFLKNNVLGNMSLPLNLRDNFFIIARKDG